MDSISVIRVAFLQACSQKLIVSLVSLCILGIIAITPSPVFAQSTAKPNIILIMTDDQQWQSTQYMPRVRDKLGGKGMTFTNAFVTTPLCCPSRVSILTGKFTHNHGVWWNDETDLGGVKKFTANGLEKSTIATMLKPAGYKTSYIGKYLNGYGYHANIDTIPQGWDDWNVHGGGNGFYGFHLNENGKKVTYHEQDGKYFTDVIKDKAVTFIKGADKPFFLLFAPIAPHMPATPAKRHEDTCNDIPFPKPPSFNEQDISDKPQWMQSQPLLTTQGIQNLTQNRAKQICSLKAVDEAVGAILTALGSEINNTVIIFTSDNGYAWGEHRWNTKLCIYDECSRVPMIVHAPMISQTAKKNDNFVFNIDLAPTIAEFAGVKAPGVDGTSLLPLLKGEHVPWRQWVLMEHINFTYFKGTAPSYDAAIRTKDFKYAKLGTGEEELYDLKHDPYEMNNQAGSTAYSRQKNELITLLTRAKQLGGPDAPPPTSPPTISQQPATTLQVTLFLHGIGNAGDNTTPGKGGNTSPLTLQRPFIAEVLTSELKPVRTVSGVVNYTNAGNFTGLIQIPGLPTGNYFLRVKTTTYLKRVSPQLLALTAGSSKQLPPLSLTVGDINNDNLLNILDYHLLLSCISVNSSCQSDAASAAYFDNEIQTNGGTKYLADINDDGIVDEIDYNLWLREISVLNGD